MSVSPVPDAAATTSGDQGGCLSAPQVLSIHLHDPWRSDVP